MEKKRRLPMDLEVYRGSITDVVTLKRTVENLRDAMPDIEIILDRDFFSHQNLGFFRTIRTSLQHPLSRRV